jgi:hypothetical protein
MSKVLAVILAISGPTFAFIVNGLSYLDAIRFFVLCAFPIILIFKPPFIRSYLGDGLLPITLGWIAFIAIFLQIFLFKF